jgi:hypothetical protein
MGVKSSCAAALIAAAMSGSAMTGAAAAEAPDTSGGRYTMSPVDGGFLRLDTQTGSVAMCARSGGDWACKAVEDRTSTGPSSEMTKLEQENRELRDRVKALEETLETSQPEAAEGPPGGKVQLPTDAEVDQALDYLERVYKKVREHLKDLDKPLPPPGAAPPPPGNAPPPPPGPPPPKGSL